VSLETGEKIDGRVVVVLLITDDVINRVEAFGKTQNQPFRASRMLQYEWRPGQAMDADDADFTVGECDENNLLVPAPVVQQQHVQDPNPFAILADNDDDNNDEEVGDIDNHNNEKRRSSPRSFRKSRRGIIHS